MLPCPCWVPPSLSVHKLAGVGQGCSLPHQNRDPTSPSNREIRLTERSSRYWVGRVLLLEAVAVECELIACCLLWTQQWVSYSICVVMRVILWMRHNIWSFPTENDQIACSRPQQLLWWLTLCLLGEISSWMSDVKAQASISTLL